MTATEKSRLPLISALTLIAAGVFWAYAALSGQGDPLLVWPSAASLTSGGLILSGRRVEIARRTSIATSLYNLLIFGYGAYSALALSGSGFASYTYIALAGYLAAALVFLFLTLRLYADSAAFAHSSTQSVEDNTENTAR